MKVVTINGENFLVESSGEVLVNAMKMRKDKVDQHVANDYVKAENIGALISTLKYANATFYERDLEPRELGFMTMASARMDESKKFAISSIENSYFDSLGE